MRALIIVFIILLLTGCHRNAPIPQEITVANFTCFAPNAELRMQQQPGSYNDPIPRPLYTIDAASYLPFAYTQYYADKNLDNPYWASFGNKNFLPASALKRVVAYTFRGDGRGPNTLKQANGFTYWKYDNYELLVIKWRSYLHLTLNPIDTMLAFAMRKYPNYVTENLLNPYTHTLSELGSNFVSTSRSNIVAKRYAHNGWVYIVLAVGGIEIPQLAKNPLFPNLPHPYAAYHNQEIAVPGSVAFDKIMAYTKVANDKFTGQICILNTVIKQQPLMAKNFLRALSG